MRRRTWVLAGAAGLVALAAIAGIVFLAGGKEATPAAAQAAPNTAPVQRGKLAAMVSLDGTLTYRAQPDGSPYAAINQADGTYTELPRAGEKVGCGAVFYRVDDDPVLLLCGDVPAYRDLKEGDRGDDVRQLNRNLHVTAGREFTWETEQALEALQHKTDMAETGELDLADAIFLPSTVRVAKVVAELGGPARAGAQIAQATSDTLEVQVSLDASQQGEVREGDRALITLPGNESATGTVKRLGRVAEAPAGQDDTVGAATISAYIALDHPQKARGLDQAPVSVDVKTKGVAGVLSVPVTALVGKAGGGFAVEMVGDDGQRELVTVELGLFDTTSGRVEVEGDLEAGDQVVVPSE